MWSPSMSQSSPIRCSLGILEILAFAISILGIVVQTHFKNPRPNLMFATHTLKIFLDFVCFLRKRTLLYRCYAGKPGFPSRVYIFHRYLILWGGEVMVEKVIFFSFWPEMPSEFSDKPMNQKWRTCLFHQNLKGIRSKTIGTKW